MREAFELNKQFILGAVGLIAVILLVLPLAHRLDDSLDDRRPLYENRSEMASVQHRHLAQLGEVSPMTVEPDEAVVVFPTEDGTGTFTAAPDSQVSVKPTDSGFCVRARSVETDEVAPWRCWDEGVDPLMDPGYAP
ncbi:hypothetical protein [Nocardioides houyundeii]|uniref:hypothetical protein n=1 Tax=Nocardioides houyundeii TaxID=2045452 RepID=UPI000C794623|nr:hypothetical protein [Nocardioides houyundeii]